MKNVINDKNNLIQQFKKQNIKYKTNELLSNYSTWKIGGVCDVVVFPTTSDQIAEIIKLTCCLQIPSVVIGQGSNVLFSDEGLRGILIHLGYNYSNIEINNNNLLKIQSGCWVPLVARTAMRTGLSGIEHIVGIPGTIGGLVSMNGGSQRKSISSNVKRVWAIDNAGKSIVLNRNDCCFSYRKSIFQESYFVITQVELNLDPRPEMEIRKEMISILEDRRNKFPRKEPNCGSVFKSDPELYETFGTPGKIIEKLGLKGYRIGAAEVSSIHANFIVNQGNASSLEVIELIKHIIHLVYNKTNFLLECEVQYINCYGITTPVSKL